MDSRSSIAAHGAGRSGPSQRFTHAGPAALMRCGRPRADVPRVGLAVPTRIRLTCVSRGAHGLRSGRHCPDAARRSPWGTALQAACAAPAGAWPPDAPGQHSPVYAQCCARLMRRAALPLLMAPPRALPPALKPRAAPSGRPCRGAQQLVYS